MPQNYRARIKLMLLELLILLARKAGKRIRHRGADSVREYVDHLIESYFREEFRLDSLARKIGIDKSRPLPPLPRRRRHDHHGCAAAPPPQGGG